MAAERGKDKEWSQASWETCGEQRGEGGGSGRRHPGNCKAGRVGGGGRGRKASWETHTGRGRGERDVAAMLANTRWRCREEKARSQPSREGPCTWRASSTLCDLSLEGCSLE
eukprot:356821-Chlamydomonas_euryale.AAC.1